MDFLKWLLLHLVKQRNVLVTRLSGRYLTPRSPRGRTYCFNSVYKYFKAIYQQILRNYVSIDPFTKRHKLDHNGRFPKFEVLHCSQKNCEIDPRFSKTSVTRSSLLNHKISGESENYNNFRMYPPHKNIIPWIPFFQYNRSQTRLL